MLEPVPDPTKFLKKPDTDPTIFWKTDLYPGPTSGWKMSLDLDPQPLRKKELFLKLYLSYYKALVAMPLKKKNILCSFPNINVSNGIITEPH